MRDPLEELQRSAARSSGSRCRRRGHGGIRQREPKLHATLQARNRVLLLPGTFAGCAPKPRRRRLQHGSGRGRRWLRRSGLRGTRSCGARVKPSNPARPARLAESVHQTSRSRSLTSSYALPPWAPRTGVRKGCAGLLAAMSSPRARTAGAVTSAFDTLREAPSHRRADLRAHGSDSTSPGPFSVLSRLPERVAHVLSKTGVDSRDH